MRYFFGIIVFVCLGIFSYLSLAGAPDESKANLNPDEQGFIITSPKTVVELFTSQGCSSCPSANKFVVDIGRNNDVLVLSYSVDYWDYLGWEDTFGKKEFSDRQREYGQHLGGEVYTPQMIVNGRVHSNKYTREQILSYNISKRLDLKIQQTGKNLYVKLDKPLHEIKDMQVFAVYYQNGLVKVPVKSGENKGRVLPLANVVKICTEIVWNEDDSGFEVKPPADDQSLAILIQEHKGGPILAALDYRRK